MIRLLTLILSFLVGFPVFSEGRNTITNFADSEKNSKAIPKALVKKTEEADEDEGDEDEEPAEPKPSDKNTKPTNKPGTPSTVSDSTLNYQEVDPEKRKYLTREGLTNIKLAEEKGNSKAISRILLSNPIPEVRVEAARSLGRIGKGVKSLHKAIDSDGYEVRQQAYRSIEKIGSRLSMKYFMNGTKSTDLDIRISSYRGLGKTKSSYGRDMIFKSGLESKEPGVVSAALYALGFYSKREDIEIFTKYLNSNQPEHQTGAISGLGNSKQPLSLDILVSALSEYPKFEPEIVIALTQKKNLPATLVLIRYMHSSKNENLQALIQKELYERKAYGKYAIIKSSTATMKRYSKANSEKVAVLFKGEVARIRKITDKLYRAKMNGQIVEDKYYLLQAVSKDPLRKPLVEGWVFGPKINIINLANPKKKSGEESDFGEEDSEDEKIILPPPPEKKEPSKPVVEPTTPVKPENPKNKEKEKEKEKEEFLDEDEDE
ncbi:MAG: hypothetical protein SFU98_07735 [Leptospiraceae bacterium]|nr:hypothetical protein [Leptospiraceae bacterium]